MYSDLDGLKSRGCCVVPDASQKNENINQHSCCKLDAYDWLADINLVDDKRLFDCIEVRFKNSRKEFFRITEDIKVKRGDVVAVEASPGHDIGIVSLTGEIVRLQMHKKKVDPKSDSIKKVYRKARTSDVEKWIAAASKEVSTMISARRIVMEQGLEMKINDVEYQGDNTKVIFYYTAEERVDFRQLIRVFAERFSVRIEMKQIGVRQESSRLGGIGPCGRELCCSSWLTDFKSVSTSAARTQQLSLNPQKLAGQCGKLKCCLNFEVDQYQEALNDFPDSRKRLKTKEGEAYFLKMDVLKGMMWYSYADQFGSYIGLQKEKVKEIQQMNAKGEQPESLEDFTEKIVDVGPSFDDVIGQDDLTRFDHASKSKKKKGKRNNRNNQGRNRNNGNSNRPQNNAKGKNSEGAKKEGNSKNQNNNRPKNSNQSNDAKKKNPNNRNGNNKNRKWRNNKDKKKDTQ
jgi:cell fate regulator YaaT (PSP1 superfamily)